MDQKALKHYEKCWFIRSFEAAIARAAAAGKVPGLVHLSTGSEVADVLLAHHLDWRRDKVTGSHRSHGIALACGTEPLDVAKEILGKKGGLSDGLGGTQHLIATSGETSFLMSNGIVGAQVPLAAGAALSAKSRGSDGIGVAVFGDGAANQGAVFETMNLAVVLKLPMLFVMYNNGMAQSTSVAQATESDFSDRARSFGLNTWKTDSNDYPDCARTLHQGAASARRSEPGFVEVKVTRDHGHYYADGEDFDASPAIENFEKYLLTQGFNSKLLRVAKKSGVQKAAAIVAEAMEAADA
ncbi:MAG: thiamine pyrophosphate-dependent dehydrogenase E1 component subunit alpha [Kordiimonadaceae bacterium]|nr:thiamine pyrophosphate-dependent dehydrogenase E1 component subunit alpha [Kordiimonadaceae bacterium]MBO6568120.1 thiamine pyrophosphate-dependent dehydrogenase E1 component subunit alpha [Kordiimonadaceae bacterium]MBO6964150.1 thiamine pyrophosphate-dependent dehydrogenase E1 component subunit alpha [Kordiimonadaceae bacterium]